MSLLLEIKNLRAASILSTTCIEQLALNSGVNEYSEREVVWDAGDEARYFCVITSGLIEICRHSRGEEDSIMGLFGPGDVIGLSALLRGAPYPCTARCISKRSRIIKLYARPLLGSNSPVANELHTWIRERLSNHEELLLEKIDVLNAGNVENRLFELLAQLARRFGTIDRREGSRIPLRLTRVQVGRYINVRFETVIRVVGRWQKEGLIIWNEEGILIPDFAALEKKVTNSFAGTLETLQRSSR